MGGFSGGFSGGSTSNQGVGRGWGAFSSNPGGYAAGEGAGGAIGFGGDVTGGGRAAGASGGGTGAGAYGGGRVGAPIDQGGAPIAGAPTTSAGGGAPGQGGKGTTPGMPTDYASMTAPWYGNMTLNPEDQARLDSQRQLQQGLMNQGLGMLGQQGNLPDMMPLETQIGSGGDYADTRQKAVDAMYGQATSRLDPQWQQQQSDLQTQLAQQGISLNSDAYSRAMQNFNQGKTDAYQQALYNAINAGGTEASRDFGMDLQRQQAYNQAVNAGFANAMNRYTTGQNIIGQNLQYGNVQQPNFPGFATGGAANPADLMGAANAGYQANVGNVNAQNAQNAQMWQGIASLAAAFFA